MKLLYGLEERPDDAINKAIDKTIEDAESEWSSLEFEGSYPTTGFGISTLRPSHVGDPNANNYNWWDMAIGAANTWQDWMNTVIDEKIYIIIAGVFNLSASPSVTEFAFKANGQDLPVQNLEQMYAFEETHAYLSAPFVIKPEGNLTGRLYGKTAQTDKIGLIGFAIGKRAILILES